MTANPPRIRVPASRYDAREKRLFELALQHWLDWLLAFHLPRKQGHRVNDELPLSEVYEAVIRIQHSNTDHGDSVLAGLLREERAGWDWPASVHAIVLDQPRVWQIVLLGSALGQSQEDIGKAAGVGQQRVSVVLSVARSRFMIRLRMLGATDRICRKILGYAAAPLRHA